MAEVEIDHKAIDFCQTSRNNQTRDALGWGKTEPPAKPVTGAHDIVSDRIKKADARIR
jgi:hypothetical protein